jgi:hypothetical protein
VADASVHVPSGCEAGRPLCCKIPCHNKLFQFLYTSGNLLHTLLLGSAINVCNTCILSAERKGEPAEDHDGEGEAV